MGCIEEVAHNAIAVYWNPLESSAKVRTPEMSIHVASFNDTHHLLLLLLVFPDISRLSARNLALRANRIVLNLIARDITCHLAETLIKQFPPRVTRSAFYLSDFCADKCGGAMSQYGFLESKRREGFAIAYPGRHVRGAATAYAYVHAAFPSRLLSN